jgi:glucose-1-phosphate adenylyltransferase
MISTIGKASGRNSLVTDESIYSELLLETAEPPSQITQRHWVGHPNAAVSQIRSTFTEGNAARTQAIIMAGGQDTRLSVLSRKRVKPALPFAGKYRIIDFVLSNCVNSGIFNVGILTQYRPHSLNDHIRAGRPWDLDRELSGGVTFLQPYQRDGDGLEWYRGTADAVYRNLDFILRQQTEAVLVLSGDHVYKMDYNPLLRYHREKQADVTIGVIDVLPENASQFGVLVADDEGRVVEFQEKSRRPQIALASMGIYVFRTESLVQSLREDACLPGSSHDFDQDVLPRTLTLGYRLYAYPFQGYWVDVGTVQTYWEANMDLLLADPPLNLLDRDWVIHTRSEERPPVNIRTGAAVSHSLITDGCVIEGRVEYSVLSPGVRVRAGAVVRDSIVLTDCDIGSGAIVDRAILDKNIAVGEMAYIGFGMDYVPNRLEPDLSTGITLVGKNTRLPAGLRVGRNCVVYSDLVEDDFLTDFIASGQSIGFRASSYPTADAPANHNSQPVGNPTLSPGNLSHRLSSMMLRRPLF